MTIDYRTRGVCSTRMVIDVEDDTIQSVKIFNGCDGKPTSCPDQLAQALKQAVNA